MPRGGYRANAGRPKGVVSRVTREKRQFLKAFIDGTEAEALECWAKISNPGEKFKLWLTASEFVYPRLGRQELVGDGGGAIQVQIVKYSDPAPGTGQ
jgi:hypothetical protein